MQLQKLKTKQRTKKETWEKINKLRTLKKCKDTIKWILAASRYTVVIIILNIIRRQELEEQQRQIFKQGFR